MSASAAAPALPGMLRDNPRLDQWVRFDTQGRVTVSTGRVEIGQGVLTAMRQIAAEELDISPDRILLQTGDTELTPNEGYTAGSQSIQFGGVALRQACAEVRLLFLDRAAAQLGHQRDALSVENGAILHKGQSTGQDYWSLAASVDLQREATGRAPIKQASQHRVVGQNLPRTDLADKVFGGPAFLHDVALDGMLHARVVRQPCRGATIRAIDEAAIRRAARGPIEIVRDGNFVAILGPDETFVEAAAAIAPGHVAWDNVEALNPMSEEGRWLLQQPSIDKTHGAPPTDPAPAGRAYEATYTRMHIAHASIGPSCGLALYKDGHLQVWTHCQGVYPLRAALARTLKLDPAAISVKHVQGPGCYGHNGADDAAADAAVIALRRPGQPIRVRWRREEEFGSEVMREVERRVILSVLDRKWREHLYEMDYLREGIGLRAMAQKDPLVEYTAEGERMFTELSRAIRGEVVLHLFHAELAPEQAQQELAQQQQGNGNVRYEHETAAGAEAIAAAGGVAPTTLGLSPVAVQTGQHAKLGRNDPCWCGSGKKFKKCHGA